jgi:hypothetical protein
MLGPCCERGLWDRRQGPVGADAVGRDVVARQVCHVDELRSQRCRQADQADGER